MKSNLILILVLICVLSSCKKDSTQPSPSINSPSPSAFKFSCNINGVSWGTDSTYNVYIFDTSISLRQLICIGSDSLRSVSVDWVGIGVFTMAVAMDTSVVDSSAYISYEGYKNGVYLDEYYPISGKMHYTAYDSIMQTVSGTFESVLVEQNVHDTVVITNGKFTNLHFDIWVL